METPSLTRLQYSVTTHPPVRMDSRKFQTIPDPVILAADEIHEKSSPVHRGIRICRSTASSSRRASSVGGRHLTRQPKVQTRDRITQIKLGPVRILPQQEHQIIHEARVRQLRRGSLHCVRDSLSRPIPVQIGLGNRGVKIQMDHQSAHHQDSENRALSTG